jgi:hypothetical protein
MDDLLTPEEMKVAIGLTADDAMIKYAHGLSDFIVVCQAQGGTGSGGVEVTARCCQHHQCSHRCIQMEHLR